LPGDGGFQILLEGAEINGALIAQRDRELSLDVAGRGKRHGKRKGWSDRLDHGSVASAAGSPQARSGGAGALSEMREVRSSIGSAAGRSSLGGGVGLESNLCLCRNPDQQSDRPAFTKSASRPCPIHRSSFSPSRSWLRPLRLLRLCHSFRPVENSQEG
jgi:hypothetical protein